MQLVRAVRTTRPRGQRKPRRTNGSYRRRPVQARSQDTVEVILSAAAQLLSRTGYDRFTTNHVAKLAGVSIGSLYQYFPGKQALVAALLDRHVIAFGEQMRGRMGRVSQPSLEDMIRYFCESMVEAHRNNPALHRVFVEEPPRKGVFVAKGEAALERAIALFSAYLARHAAEVAPHNHDLCAFIVVRTIDALIHSAVVSRPDLLQGEEFASELTTLLACALHDEASDHTPAAKAREHRSEREHESRAITSVELSTRAKS